MGNRKIAVSTPRIVASATIASLRGRIKYGFDRLLFAEPDTTEFKYNICGRFARVVVHLNEGLDTAAAAKAVRSMYRFFFR